MREERTTKQDELAVPKLWEPFTALRNTFDELMNPDTARAHEDAHNDMRTDTLRTA
jgi:hypothetical protein